MRKGKPHEVGWKNSVLQAESESMKVQRIKGSSVWLECGVQGGGWKLGKVVENAVSHGKEFQLFKSLGRH